MPGLTHALGDCDDAATTIGEEVRKLKDPASHLGHGSGGTRQREITLW